MKKSYPSGGDTGTSRLVSGQMVGKDHANFDAVGTVDELSCFLGWAKCACDDAGLRERIEWVQNTLFDLGSCITGWSQTEFPEQPVARLEREIAEWQGKIPDLRGFILPGGTELASRLHLARAVARRLERCIVHLKESGARTLNEHSLRFANRLSDWIFQAARLANVRAGIEETFWKQDTKQL